MLIYVVVHSSQVFTLWKSYGVMWKKPDIIAWFLVLYSGLRRSKCLGRIYFRQNYQNINKQKVPVSQSSETIY